MSEILRKIGLFAIGTIAIAEEKFDEMVQDIKKEGLNKEEGKQYVIEVLSEGDKLVTSIGDKIDSKIQATIEKGGIATKKDLESIKTRIEDLEKILEEKILEKSVSTAE